MWLVITWAWVIIGVIRQIVPILGEWIMVMTVICIVLRFELHRREEIIPRDVADLSIAGDRHDRHFRNSDFIPKEG